jgi:hypothetical protein
MIYATTREEIETRGKALSTGPPRRTFHIIGPRITERTRKNPKYPTGSHPDQQSLFSSIR